MYRFTSPTAARHPWKLLAFLLLPTCALAANSVVNMSHYDLMRPDFAGMAREGVAGVIHEATFRLERDARYSERQQAALKAGLLWGAYHFADATNPTRQADHFLDTVTAAPLDNLAKLRSGVFLVLDFDKKGLSRCCSKTVYLSVLFIYRFNM